MMCYTSRTAAAVPVLKSYNVTLCHRVLLCNDVKGSTVRAHRLAAFKGLYSGSVLSSETSYQLKTKILLDHIIC